MKTTPPTKRKRDILMDIDLGLERLGLQLQFAVGERSRARIVAEIEELKRRRQLVQSDD